MKEKDTTAFPLKVLSFVSGKGGVGKTIMAVNTAYECAMFFDVLLVDFDLFNCGLTLWFRGSLGKQNAFAPDLMTLSDIVLAYKPGDPKQDKILTLISNRDLARIGIGNGEHGVHVLPCFVPNTQSQTMHHAEIQSGAPRLRTPQDLARLLSISVPAIARRHRCELVIFDCHPGVVAYSSPCCAMSDCNILISDFDRSSLLSTVVFTALVERHIKSYPYNLVKTSQRHWRVAINKVPSPRQFDDCSSRLNDAMTVAKDSALSALFSGISENMVPNLKSPLVTVPDLEELRDHRLDRKQELSPARRGGNGFILSTKAMIRNMGYVLAPLSRRISFCTDDPHIKAAFEALRQKYYADRGLGRSGIAKLSLVAAFLDVALAAWLLSAGGTKFAILPEVGLLSLFVFALASIAKQNHFSGQCYDIFCRISQLDSGNHSEKQKHILYNRGGNPATTSSIWFPKAVWFLVFLVGFLVTVKVGSLPTEFMKRLATLLNTPSKAIGLTADWATVVALLFGSIFTLLPFKKDITFFWHSFLIAVGVYKDKEITEYY